MKLKNVLRILVLLGIITAIVYLQSLKVPSQESSTTDSSKNEIQNPFAYINSEPFLLADYIGEKVILVDFWTYSCINCQRTTPYLNAWWDKYEDEGLLIVGIHSPEFEFEKNEDNVKAAVEKFEIKYPVVMDNDHSTWSAFGNRYWPRKYLIDLNGDIVYDHIGEGGYDETESEIQKLLGLSEEMSSPDVISVDFSQIESPETYFGSDRGSNTKLLNEEPASILSNTAYLIGDWLQSDEYAESTGENASLLYEFNSKNVYLVASAESPVEVEIYVDGEPLGTITVKADELYSIFEGVDYETRTLKLVPKGTGLKIFTFTFG